MKRKQEINIITTYFNDEILDFVQYDSTTLQTKNINK